MRILLYPHILQKFYKIKTESMFRQFEETTENVRDANPEKYARLYEEMKNYNEELIKNNQVTKQISLISDPSQHTWKPAHVTVRRSLFPLATPGPLPIG